MPQVAKATAPAKAAQKKERRQDNPRDQTSFDSSMLGPFLAPRSGACACGGGCPHCTENKNHLPSATTGPTRSPTTVPASVRSALISPGSPLPQHFRKRAEMFFGHDLRHVRIHEDGSAATAAAESRAHALTNGTHILLSRRRRDLSRPETQRTVIHEIAHILQPNTEGPPRSTFETEGSPNETEARHASDHFPRDKIFTQVRQTSSRQGICRERDPRLDELVAVIDALPPTVLTASGIAEALQRAAPDLDLTDPDNYQPLRLLFDSHFGSGSADEIFSEWFTLQQNPVALPDAEPAPTGHTELDVSAGSTSEGESAESDSPDVPSPVPEAANTPEPRSLTSSFNLETLTDDELVEELANITIWLRAHPQTSPEHSQLRSMAITIAQALVVHRGREYFQQYGYLVPDNLLPFLYVGMLEAGMVNGFLAGISREIEPETVEALNQELSNPINALGFEAGNIGGILWGAGGDLVMNVVGLLEMAGWLAWHAPLPVIGRSLADFEDLYDQFTDPEGHAAREAAEQQFYRDLFDGLLELHSEFTRDPSVLLHYGDALGEAAGEASGRWFTHDFMNLPPHEKGFAIGRVEGMIIMEIALLFLGPEEWIARGASATAQALRASRLAREILVLIEGIPALRRILEASRRLSGIARETSTLGHATSEAAEILPEATRAVDEVSDLARAGEETAELTPPPPTVVERPQLEVIQGGGETTPPRRGHLSDVSEGMPPPDAEPHVAELPVSEEVPEEMRLAAGAELSSPRASASTEVPRASIGDGAGGPAASSPPAGRVIELPSRSSRPSTPRTGSAASGSGAVEGVTTPPLSPLESPLERIASTYEETLLENRHLMTRFEEIEHMMAEDPVGAAAAAEALEADLARLHGGEAPGPEMTDFLTGSEAEPRSTATPDPDFEGPLTTDMPVTLSTDEMGRFTDLVNGDRWERHHSFFSYLLGGIQRSRGASSMPRHWRLVRLDPTVHQAGLHTLWDIMYPQLARREGAAMEIAEAIRRGDTLVETGEVLTPTLIADRLELFYQDLAAEHPDMLTPTDLDLILRVVRGIRRREAF